MLTRLTGKFLVGVAVLLHRRSTRPREAAARMIGTGRLYCSYREVEGADAGHDSCKTAHVRVIISVRLVLM
jgi:hypothetical protein